MLRTLALTTSFALALAACSSDDSEEAQKREGDIKTNESFSGSINMTGTVTVWGGATLTIEPGADIKCSPNSSIIVAGTLRKAPGARAKISCPKWIGIIVAKGGALDLDGIDIENADTAIELTQEAALSKVANASLTSALRPFTVRASSKLELTSVKATARKAGDNETSVSEIFGSLVAKRIHYNAGGNEGIMLKEGGEAVIEDSVLKAENGLDLVSAYGAKSLQLRYSTLDGAHCGPHIQGIDTFEIDHITSESNIFGITIYAATTGTVKDSNFNGVSAWLDLQGDHGPLTIENVYTQGAEIIANTDPPKITKASARVPGAAPR